MGSRAFVALMFLLASCASAPPKSGVLPDPFAGEVPGPPLTRSQRKTATSVVALAEAGRFSQALGKLASLPAEHPVRELLQREVHYLEGRQPLWPQVAGLVEKYPAYRAAWELALMVAEREGRWREAAGAAATLAKLVPGGPWARKSQELRTRFLAQEEAQAATLLAEGKAEEALAAAQVLLQEAPHRASTRELAVRAALAAGQVEAAKLLVLSLPEEGSGLLLKAEVAAVEQNWELAAALLRKLPSSYPGRCEKLLEAEEKARWQKASSVVQRARDSLRVTRAQLASLLVFYFPEILERGQGQTPLFEDVIGIPEQGEVIAVARAELLRGDPLTRRFSPMRAVSVKDLEGVLSRLVTLLGLSGFRVCSPGEKADCLPLPENGRFLSGSQVASLLLQVRERQKC